MFVFPSLKVAQCKSSVSSVYWEAKFSSACFEDLERFLKGIFGCGLFLEKNCSQVSYTNVILKIL